MHAYFNRVASIKGHFFHRDANVIALVYVIENEKKKTVTTWTCGYNTYIATSNLASYSLSSTRYNDEIIIIVNVGLMLFGWNQMHVIITRASSWC